MRPNVSCCGYSWSKVRPWSDCTKPTSSSTRTFAGNLNNGRFIQNPSWAPFKLKQSKSKDNSVSKPDKRKYKPSQETLAATFTGVIAFYKYLMNEEHLYGNPAQIAKPDCRHFIKDAQVKEARRLTEAQWQYVFDVAVSMADEDPIHERSLFVICALKTLFLRVSELSERPQWTPVMSHFWQDSDGNWWLRIFGKGRKLRDITVPDSFIPFLKRYRAYRGLSPLPASRENQPIVEKIRGHGGMTSRQLTRVVQQVFDRAYDEMRQAENKAHKLKEASTHWLRHTGASMEIERGRRSRICLRIWGTPAWPRPILFMSIQKAGFEPKAARSEA